MLSRSKPRELMWKRGTCELTRTLSDPSRGLAFHTAYTIPRDRDDHVVHMLQTQHSGHWSKRTAASSKPSWATWQVPGQPELHSQTRSQKGRWGGGGGRAAAARGQVMGREKEREEEREGRGRDPTIHWVYISCPLWMPKPRIVQTLFMLSFLNMHIYDAVQFIK